MFKLTFRTAQTQALGRGFQKQHRCVPSLHYNGRIDFSLSTSLFLAGNSGQLTWVRNSSHKSSASATHACQCVQYFRVQTMVWCRCLGLLTCAQMSMHAIAHGGCTDTVRESALEVDSGREREKKKIPCLIRDSNPRQYCA